MPTELKVLQHVNQALHSIVSSSPVIGRVVVDNGYDRFTLDLSETELQAILTHRQAVLTQKLRKPYGPTQ